MGYTTGTQEVMFFFFLLQWILFLVNMVNKIGHLILFTNCFEMDFLI